MKLPYSLIHAGGQRAQRNYGHAPTHAAAFKRAARRAKNHRARSPKRKP